MTILLKPVAAATAVVVVVAATQREIPGSQRDTERIQNPAVMQRFASCHTKEENLTGQIQRIYLITWKLREMNAGQLRSTPMEP